MSYYSWIGIAGLALLVVAWIPETLKTLREKKSPIELKFSLVYTAGAFCLMIYAYLLKDLVFTVLNLLTTLMALLNAYYKLIEKKTKSKGKK